MMHKRTFVLKSSDEYIDLYSAAQWLLPYNNVSCPSWFIEIKLLLCVSGNSKGRHFGGVMIKSLFLVGSDLSADGKSKVRKSIFSSGSSFLGALRGFSWNTGDQTFTTKNQWITLIFKCIATIIKILVDLNDHCYLCRWFHSYAM